MPARNKFTSQERAARSRLARLLPEHDLICGSVASMASLNRASERKRERKSSG
ncbi:MAG: hypothetical protein HYV27_00980 [Candidatus Hydrogenedentes bacterium]|nr:hypothetical protein [Candidatus Hydrogenedentota bacterium]